MDTCANEATHDLISHVIKSCVPANPRHGDSTVLRFPFWFSCSKAVASTSDNGIMFCMLTLWVS